MAHFIVAPTDQRREKARKTGIVGGGGGAFYESQGLKFGRKLRYLVFTHSFIQQIFLEHKSICQTVLDKREHNKSSTLDIHSSSGKPYLVNGYPASV